MISCSIDEPGLQPEITNQGTTASEANLDLERSSFGDFSIIEGFSYGDNRTSGSEEISLEVAAMIGAQYILDIFNESLDGKYLQLTYSYNHHISESTWSGQVFSDASHLEKETSLELALFTFTIDAITKARLRISVNIANLKQLHGLSWEEILALDDEAWLALFPMPDEAEINDAKSVAEAFARKHFNESEVVSVQPGFYHDANLYVLPASLVFHAIDSTDARIDLMLQRTTNALVSISTPLDEPLN